jgi:hypothetical protein
MQEIPGKDLLEQALVRALNERLPIVVELDLGRQVDRNAGIKAGARRRLQREPVKNVRAERQEVRSVADAGKGLSSKELDRDHAPILCQIDLGILDEARQIGDDENVLVLVAADECDRAGVVGVQKFDGAAAEGAKLLS